MYPKSVLILDLDAPKCHTENLEWIPQTIKRHRPAPDLFVHHWSDLHFEKPSFLPQLIFVRQSPRTLALKVLPLLRKRWADARIIGLFCTERDTLNEVTKVLDEGLDDFLFCPFREQDIVPRVQHTLDHATSSPKLPTSQEGTFPVRSPFIGETSTILHTLDKASLIAEVDVNVLISGETGTGKEIFAKHVHDKSHRNTKPFIPVNCGAVPDLLLENELFGHAKGAFTGAWSSEGGLLAEAEGGTLFLDEIDSLSLGSQGKLLRFLEYGEYRPLGSSMNRRADVRVIAATNQHLEKKVEEGSFRRDFFYRLNVTRLSLPPLRDRKKDILLLLDHYVQEMNTRYDLHVQSFTERARYCLEEYHWPGNVRELKNLVESLLITIRTGTVEMKDLPDYFQREETDGREVDKKERELLLTTLRSTKWNRTKAAHELHWSRMTLYRKMAKYHLDIPQKRRPHKPI